MLAIKKTLLGLVLTFGAIPALACDCHGGGPMFGGFASWQQMPAANCVPSHANLSLGLGQESRAAEESASEQSQSAAQDETKAESLKNEVNGAELTKS